MANDSWLNKEILLCVDHKYIIASEDFQYLENAFKVFLAEIYFAHSEILGSA